MIDQWLVNKILNSTSVTQYTTSLFPVFIPSTFIAPAIIYKDIGFNRNLLYRNVVYSLVSFHNSKSGVENINNSLYALFETASSYIREQSTAYNVRVDSVTIVNNVPLIFEDNYWSRPLDISVWYR